MGFSVLQQVMWAVSVVASLYSAIKFREARSAYDRVRDEALAHVKELRRMYLECENDRASLLEFVQGVEESLGETGCPVPHPEGLCERCRINWRNIFR